MHYSVHRAGRKAGQLRCEGSGASCKLRCMSGPAQQETSVFRARKSEWSTKFLTGMMEKPGDGSGVSPKKPLLRSLRKKSVVQPLRKGYARRREIIEHYPREISLTFDGETHATLLLNADVNTLNLSLDQNRLPNFIGILSDQDLCFLILSADDLASTEEQTYSLGLSDGRSLEATVLPGTLGAFDSGRLS